MISAKSSKSLTGLGYVIVQNLKLLNMDLEMDGTPEDKVLKKLTYFLRSLKDSDWALTAVEKTIDNFFSSALELEEIFIQDKDALKKLSKNFPDLNFHRPVNAVVENIIKHQFLDEHLTLYAIEKYILLYSKDDFAKLLENVLSEVELRKQIFTLIKEYPIAELDIYRLNNFLCDILSSSDLKSKVLKALKLQTLTFLKAIRYGEFLSGQDLINEVISCLESQPDLRLWFTLMKNENLQTILELSVIYNNFLKAILKFFDKFADEIESNYDEELNVQYSHVNLDFEDFVKVVNLFLKTKSLKKEISEYLESKTLTDKNFCFWVDVKACL